MSTPITRRNLVRSAAVAAAGAALVPAAAMADEAAPANRVCELFGIAKPVIQALMGGLTSPELAAAVSNAGGLGIVEMPDAETVQATKALTDKPFAATAYVFDPDSAAMLLEEGVDIILVGGDPVIVGAYADAGFKVIVKQLECTLENTLACQDAGAAAIICVGFGAGGCGPANYTNTAEFIAHYAPSVDIPLIAGGGMVDAATARFAIAAGAEAIYAGTRFIACEESPVQDSVKQAIIDASAEDFVLLDDGFGYMPMTRSKLTEEAQAMLASGTPGFEVFPTLQQVYYHMMPDMGDIEDTGICVGCGVSLIDSIKTAAEIVDDIASAF